MATRGSIVCRRPSQTLLLLGLLFGITILVGWIRPRHFPTDASANPTSNARTQPFSVQSLGISNASVIHMSRYHDNRGFFQELLNEEKYPPFARGPKQISVSHSQRHVVRGLHRSPYFKLVTVLSGRIIDILVDLDPSSPSFKQWRSVELSADTPTQVFIPPKFGHGFVALEDNTIVCYAQGGTFVAGNEMDVNIFDPEIGITLPELRDQDLIMSEKDLRSPSLAEALERWKSLHN